MAVQRNLFPDKYEQEKIAEEVNFKKRYAQYEKYYHQPKDYEGEYFVDGIELGNTLIYPKFFSTWTRPDMLRPKLEIFKGRNNHTHIFEWEVLSLISRKVNGFIQWKSKYILEPDNYYRYSRATISCNKSIEMVEGIFLIRSFIDWKNVDTTQPMKLKKEILKVSEIRKEDFNFMMKPRKVFFTFKD